MNRVLQATRHRHKLRAAVESVRPGLVSKHNGRAYRALGFTWERALDRAVGEVRNDPAFDNKFWLWKLRDSRDADEAKQAAAMLIEAGRKRALHVLKEALYSKSPHVREAASEAMSDIAGISRAERGRDCDLDPVANSALDAVAAAANKGVAEAKTEIAANLKDEIMDEEKLTAKDVVVGAAGLVLMALPYLTLTAFALSAVALMKGAFDTGGILGTAGTCIMIAQKKLGI